ncbi:DUF6367 family protein [Sphingomonas aquatilis]|uniref:DUF6367 family protein n=1 Tax=Sphingomonas aquatilis TaxID=93063 RepID=UPI0023F8B1E4|nr:DUF6367 family protein [Sphingomonas aquatilis]MCI4652740.1 DUF6367 family protein [Sphingomonas aquatilis]
MTLEELFGVEAGAENYAALPYLLLEVDEELLLAANIFLHEGSDWRQSKVKGLVYRIDPVRPDLRQKRHVHIASTKHTAAKNKQVSWNDDGSRHDRHSFNDKFGKRADYRDVARAALGLPTEALLEWVEPAKAAGLKSLVESIVGAEPDDRPLKIRASVERRDALDDAVDLGLPG